MFDLTQETKDAVITYLLSSGLIKEGTTDEQLEEVLDNVVRIVKASFGF